MQQINIWKTDLIFYNFDKVILEYVLKKKRCI